MCKIVTAIEQYAQQHAHKIALSEGQKTYSYQALSTAIQQTADALSAYRGKTLAIEMANSATWVIIDLACMAQSICTVPIPAFFTPAQRRHALRSAGVYAILSDKGSASSDAQQAQTFTCATKTIVIQTLTDKNETSHDVKLPVLTAKVTYTSGSTGAPKGVCLSLAAMEQVAESLVTILGREVAQHTAAILPLPILLENIAGCYATLLAGGCYHIDSAEQTGFANPARPDFARLLGYLAQVKASSCILVPELLRGLLHAMQVSQQTLPTMQYVAVGGSKVSPSLLAQAQALQLPVYQGYGLSEAASVVSVNTPTNNQHDSVGRLLPHIHLSANKTGELIIEPPAFLGYVGDEQRPQQFATGDLGHVDQHGFVQLNGRKKNLLITSFGRNISPEWPESELLSHAEIMQAMVVGDGEAYLSALIVSQPAISDEQIEAAIVRVNDGLPQYAQLKQWLRVEPFTVQNNQLTGTGRIRRNAILQRYAGLIDVLYDTQHASSY